MSSHSTVEKSALGLPTPLDEWIGDAPLYEHSGLSGAQTLFVDRDAGAYLKIAPHGTLARAALLQKYWAGRGLSAAVLMYLSEDRDYLVTAPVPGRDGTAAEHLARPERLCEVFGQSLRQLHGMDFSDCPVDQLGELLARVPGAPASPSTGATFEQWLLDDLRPFIGEASAESAAAEIRAGEGILRRDALVHGDYCLPNILLDGWKRTGFIDVAEGGVGDRNWDIAWGLWTIHHNLKKTEYGEQFLDAYGRDAVDKDRLRICALLAAME